MKFAEIVEILGESADINIISSSNDHDITSVKLWSPALASASDSTLYFSYDTQYEKHPANCIIAGKPQNQSVPGDSRNLAYTDPDQFALLFNRVQDILANRSQDSFYNYLKEVADSLRSVDALIDVAAQSFNASLVLIDRDFRILGYSTQIPVTDRLWAENIRKGYCDYEFISEVRKLKSVQTADSGSTPFEVTCKEAPYRKLASRVYCKDAWIGSLLLIEGEETYRTEHIDMLRILSVVTGYSILAHSPELLYRTSDYHSFLYNLIIGTPMESLPEAYRNLEFHDNMKVLYFKSGSEKASFVKGSDIRDALHQEMPDCHVIMHRKAVVVVCSLDEFKDPASLLSLFPAGSDAKVGISSVFHNIELLRDALEEAQDAFTVGLLISPEKRIFPFEEYSICIMLNHLSEHENILRYTNPAIPCLKKYDEINGTSLLDTLRSYLENCCSIKGTAEALYLHRNSVIYRLRKIEELCSLDLDDPAVRFRLHISFHILQCRSRPQQTDAL